MAETSGDPPVCNCGFFGNPQFDNMCSKCYKESQKQIQQQKGDSAPPASESATTAIPIPSRRDTIPASIASPAQPSPPQGATAHGDAPLPESPATGTSADGASASEKVKPRCAICNLKVTFSKLTTNKCKCGNVYCDKHRIATAHDCVFDWKGTGRAKIEKDLEKNKEKKSGGRSFQRLDSSH